MLSYHLIFLFESVCVCVGGGGGGQMMVISISFLEKTNRI